MAPQMMGLVRESTQDAIIRFAQIEIFDHSPQKVMQSQWKDAIGQQGQQI